MAQKKAPKSAPCSVCRYVRPMRGRVIAPHLIPGSKCQTCPGSHGPPLKEEKPRSAARIVMHLVAPFTPGKKRRALCPTPNAFLGNLTTYESLLEGDRTGVSVCPDCFVAFVGRREETFREML